VSIYNPAGGAPANRVQFPDNVIPPGLLSSQAQELLKLIPLPNAPGRDNGTRDNFVSSGSESFKENSFNARIDGRINNNVNTFGRYSHGRFFRDGPPALGAGGGQELVSLGGNSKARNHSFAYGVDDALSSTLLADFRFGWFKYQVNVLPFDFGTTPALDAGIPGLNESAFSSGLPAGFIEGDRGLNFGSGLGVNRCNCPLDQNETQWQLVGNITKLLGNHNFKAGADIRRANNLRVPSDAHRSGELTFSPNRTIGADGGGLGIATFLLGDVTRLRRYVSPNTDAREQQWRTAYYAQDTWRLHEKVTLNYGLRLDIINPQTVNGAGNGGFLDLATGEIRVAGVGGVGLNGDIENRLNWAPRIGATYQIDSKTVLRGGYGRSYDLGVFGSLFGHSVTQNLPVLSVQELNAPANFDRVFTLAEGPPPPIFIAVPDNGRFPLPDGVFARALPEKQRPPTVDAFNLVVQRQLSSTMSVEVGYVGNRGKNVFAGDGPAININQATLVGYPTVPLNNRRPFFAGGVPNDLGLGGAFGWTQGIDFFCNCAHNAYDSLQAKFNKAFSAGYSVKVNYTLQRQVQESADYFFYDVEMNKGPADWDRTHNFVLSLVAELPVGRGRAYMSNISPAMEAIIGGWQFNTNTIIQSGLPFSVTYRDAGLDRDTGGNNRPNLVGDPNGPHTRDQWFNATPIGSPGSAFERPAVGTFGTMARNALRGPGYWRSDASVFKHFRLSGNQRLEFRVEVVNLFNHVNLGNPDSNAAEVGVPGNNNTAAGRINSTAYFNNDPQRNFQFALKYIF
jgi:hypothetical protein